MSENRYGGWDQDESQVQNTRGNYNENEPIIENPSLHSDARRRIQRRSSDSARDFFYWFGNNGGFRALPKTVAVIAIIVLFIWIIANRRAILNGFMGILSELLPLIMLIGLLWHCLKTLINPK